MCRTQYKHHPQNLTGFKKKSMGFKRWLVKYWDDLIEAWKYLND